MKYTSDFEALLAYFPGIAAVDPRSAPIMSRRQVSAEWIRGGYTSIDPAGFNPFAGKVFYSRFSCLDELAGGSDYEGHNTALFLYEVFYALHDYVHVLALHQLARRCVGGLDPWDSIDDIQSEWFRILLLFSEAAATVAVDYWLLSARPLSEHLGRTDGFQTLTTPYLAAQDAPQLAAVAFGTEVDAPDFLVELARVYCNGWSGKIAEVSMTFGHLPPWLLREQQQALRQATLADEWLCVLGAPLSDEQRTIGRTLFDDLAPHMLAIAVDLREQIDLRTLHTPAPFAALYGWCDEPAQQDDFRFINAPRWLASGGSARNVGQRSKSYFNAQLAARYRPTDLIDSGRLRGKQLALIDPPELMENLIDFTPLSGDHDAPLNLFHVS